MVVSKCFVCASVFAHVVKSLLPNQVTKYEKATTLFKHFPPNQLPQTALGIRLCSVQGIFPSGHSAEPSPFLYLLSNLSLQGWCMTPLCGRNLCKESLSEPPAEEGKAHGLVFYGPHAKNGFDIFKGLFKKKWICDRLYVNWNIYPLALTEFVKPCCAKSCVLTLRIQGKLVFFTWHMYWFSWLKMFFLIMFLWAWAAHLLAGEAPCTVSLCSCSFARWELG